MCPHGRWKRISWVMSKLTWGTQTQAVAAAADETSRWGGTCCRLGRKESMEILVCFKLPLVSHVGRIQESEEAKYRERGEWSTGSKDCQSRERKRGRGKTTKWSAAPVSSPQPQPVFASLHPSSNFTSCFNIIFGHLCLVRLVFLSRCPPALLCLRFCFVFSPSCYYAQSKSSQKDV